MTRVLIVDDSPVDRLRAGRLLERRPGGAGEPSGLEALFAADGHDALAVLERDRPEAVVTDLQMPGMDGLELVNAVRRRHPLIPVILMTAHGSEGLAVRALRDGAASYVPKQNLAHDLLETVEAVLEAAQADRSQRRLMGCLTCTEARFELENDPALIPPLIGFLKSNLARMVGPEDPGLVRVTMALREAVLNAMDHGNLELDSTLREREDDSYHRLADERRRQPPYSNRRVHITTARETPAEDIYVIRDDGPGFDTANLPDPLDPANLEKRSGRGLLLIRAFMTEVRHNDRGNEVTLIRRRG
jgi:CheY-like chemotaxis protein/anti-sigma regulatory factor (Ser/Thr protein kinase)